MGPYQFHSVPQAKQVYYAEPAYCLVTVTTRAETLTASFHYLIQFGPEQQLGLSDIQGIILEENSYFMAHFTYMY